MHYPVFRYGKDANGPNLRQSAIGVEPIPSGLKPPETERSQGESNEPATRRLLCLDALRGLTILLMLLVNNIALDSATPSQLVHARWNGGVHLADLVFPWFLFCMGLAVPLSLRSMVSRGMNWTARFGRIFFRSVVLFLFGCAIVSAEMRRPVFSLDVLQLIALAYFLGTLLYPFRWQIRLSIAGLLLAGYGMALALFPGAPLAESHNLVKHVNETYLARFNLSGLLSVIPTTALVLIGASLTSILRSKTRSVRNKLIMMAGAGVALTACGMAWNLALPFNKTVWTPSYILLSAGLGALILAGLYWILDVKRWTVWAYPLLVYGSNALVAYVGPVLLKLLVLQRVKVQFHDMRLSLADAWLHLFIDSMGRVAGGWAYTISYMLIVWLVLALMYSRKWFVRV